VDLDESAAIDDPQQPGTPEVIKGAMPVAAEQLYFAPA
jgi:hypothetical protein